MAVKPVAPVAASHTICEAVRGFYGGIISLDPDVTEESVTYPAEGWRLPVDGLDEDWGNRAVFVTPRSHEVERYIGKAAAQRRYWPNSQAVLLIPAEPWQPWWHTVMYNEAQYVCFLEGKHAMRGGDQKPKGWAMVYYGKQDFATWRKYMAHLGWCVRMVDLR